MTEDSKAYARGYAAGKRQKVQDPQKLKAAFMRRVFLAILPNLVNPCTWQDGDGKKINTSAALTNLAWDFANDAVKNAPWDAML